MTAVKEDFLSVASDLLEWTETS